MAISPLAEVALSLRELAGLQSSIALRPWKRQMLQSVQELDLAPVRVLFTERDFADILSPPPPPTTASIDIHAQLDWLVEQTEQLDCDLHRLFMGAVPEAAGEYLRAPRAALHRLAETLEKYWSLAIAPWWPRMSALLEQDLLFRGQAAIRDTLPRMLNGIHPDLMISDDELLFEPRHPATGTFDLTVGAGGLVFVPCAFVAGPPLVTTRNVWDRTGVFFAARGVGNLATSSDPGQVDALSVLLSRRRADLLRAIRTPSTPGELARLMDVTSSAITQQLTHLMAAGLASRNPLGRKAYYRLTEEGRQLLHLMDETG